MYKYLYIITIRIMRFTLDKIKLYLQVIISTGTCVSQLKSNITEYLLFINL